MEKLVTFIGETIHEIGMLYTTLIILGLILLLTMILYFSIAIEAYLHSHTIREAFSYGKYQIVVKTHDGDIHDEISLNAWNKTHAVEKTAKRLNSIEGLLFTVSKLK